MKLFSYRNRPVHLGPYPAERLRRVAPPPHGADTARPPARPLAARPAPDSSGVAHAALEYLRFFACLRDGDVAPQRAPLPDDPASLANELKSAAYFMDASAVGVCAIPASVWHEVPAKLGHGTALVLLVEYGGAPDPGSRAAAWVGCAADDVAALRAAEVAVAIAGYVRRMGFRARAHTRDETDIDHDALVVRSGLGQRDGERIVSPHLDTRYASAVVTTDMPLAADRPLAPQSLRDRSLAHLVGLDGTRSLVQRWQRRRRPSHLGPYPMERIKRVDAPTTLIFEDEVPRVPKRAAFFERALRGDMGPKLQRERARFATKHPFAHAMTPMIRGMVPFQDGQSPIVFRRCISMT